VPTGITEADIANYLANNPAFFERHAELLASVQLTSPHGQRAVSLQERQMEMLRERIKGLERKIVEMIRNSQDNGAIADRLYRYVRELMLTAQPAELPALVVREIKAQFLVPQVALRVWGVADTFADQSFAQGVSADARSLAISLTSPYCGVNSRFEPAQWLEDMPTVASMAMIALRRHGGAGGDDTFGLLVLGSPDPTRYGADMATDFLQRLGDITSAGLSRLLPTA
jgi:uncharacterized protein YigA (DUF484 family)